MNSCFTKNSKPIKIQTYYLIFFLFPLKFFTTLRNIVSVCHLTIGTTLPLVSLNNAPREECFKYSPFCLWCAIWNKQDIYESYQFLCPWASFCKQNKLTKFPTVVFPRGIFCVYTIFFWIAQFWRTDIMEGLSPWEGHRFPPHAGSVQSQLRSCGFFMEEKWGNKLAWT